MIREFQRDDINKVADIWLDTNIKAHNFIPVEYQRCQLKLFQTFPAPKIMSF